MSYLFCPACLIILIAVAWAALHTWLERRRWRRKGIPPKQREHVL
jgi:hypothetical protein